MKNKGKRAIFRMYEKITRIREKSKRIPALKSVVFNAGFTVSEREKAQLAATLKNWVIYYPAGLRTTLYLRRAGRLTRR